MKVRRKSISIFGKNYYYFALALSFIAMYTDIRNGIWTTLIMFIILVDIFINYVKRRSLTVNSTSLLVCIYILYNLISISFALLNGFSMSICLSEVANSIVPMCFYFYALFIKEQEQKAFEKSVLIVTLLIIVSGIFYNIYLNDQYYINYLSEVYPQFNLYGFRLYPRLTSCVGSVIVGVICCVGLCFVFEQYIKDRKKYKFYILCVIMSIGILLSMQRSAIVVMLLNIFILLIYLRRIKQIRRTYIFVLIILSLILFIIILIKYPMIIKNITERVMAIPDALSERTATWNIVFGIGFKLILGMGLGTGGHRAIGVSSTINDGNYFKILYELGIVGSILFLIILIRTIYVGIIFKKKNATYLIALIGMLIQAVGSNILTFQFTVPLFWYCIGIIEKTKENQETSVLRS